MNTLDSQKVVARFFDILNELVSLKKLRGRKTFCDIYGVDRRNLHALSKDYSSNKFQACWLTYLVLDFGVSPMWLLTGLGSRYSKISEQSLNVHEDVTQSIEH